MLKTQAAMNPIDYVNESADALIAELTAVTADRDRLREALQAVVTLSDGQGRLNLMMVAGQARAALSQSEGNHG